MRKPNMIKQRKAGSMAVWEIDLYGQSVQEDEDRSNDMEVYYRPFIYAVQPKTWWENKFGWFKLLFGH